MGRASGTSIEEGQCTVGLHLLYIYIWYREYASKWRLKVFFIYIIITLPDELLTSRGKPGATV